MRKRRTYGQSLLGKQWLTSLIEIGDVRVTRGKTYANKGAVTNITLSPQGISARVQGSYNNHYKITIGLPFFMLKQMMTLLSLLKSSPLWQADLQAGVLSPDLIDALSNTNIHLTPCDWDEVNASCSCYDYGDPCKHIAAVYYCVADMIDQDPLLLLSLRGVSRNDLWDALDLPEQASGSAFPIDALPDITERFKSRTVKMEGLIDSPVASEETGSVQIHAAVHLPFKKPSTAIGLLPDHAPCFPSALRVPLMLGDIYDRLCLDVHALYPPFNEDMSALYTTEIQLNVLDTIATHYDECIQVTIKPLKLVKPQAIKDAFQSVGRHTVQSTYVVRRNIVLDIFGTYMAPWSNRQDPAPYDLSFKATTLFDFKTHTATKGALALKSTHILLDTLLVTRNEATPDDASPDTWAFLRELAHDAFTLISHGQWIPQLVKVADEQVILRMFPLLNDPAVSTALERLKTRMPEALTHYQGHPCSPDVVRDLLSMMMSHVVNRYTATFLANRVPEDDVFMLLMHGMALDISKPPERAIAEGLQRWLSPLDALTSSVKLVLQVNEGDDKETDDHAGRFRLSAYVVDNATPDTLTPLENILTIMPTADAIGISGDRALQQRVIQQCRAGGVHFSPLQQLLNSQGREHPEVNLDDMAELLRNGAAALHALGIRLILPKSVQRLASPVLQMAASLKGAHETGKSYLNLHDMLSFSHEIVLGEDTVSAEAFKQLLNNAGQLVKFREQYVMLDPDDAQRLLSKLSRPPVEPQSHLEAVATLFSQQFDGHHLRMDKGIDAVIQDIRRVDDVPLPSGLQATLRPYQERGFRWLQSNTAKGFGACLADDMGLGKTIQAISLLLHHKEKKGSVKSSPSLVICPMTLIGNWRKEIERFAPSLTVHIYHGPTRKLDVEGVDVILTTYGTVRSDVALLTQRTWQYCIIDEAQNIKNGQTAQTKAVKSIKADYRIAMTGTPVENRLSELWSLFDFLNPGYLGTAKQFKERFGSPIEKDQNPDAIEALQKVTAPFFLRRLKTDASIISDLPEKISIDEFCQLSTQQVALYQKVVESTLHTIENSEGIERKGLIFKLMTSLKQICNHPHHYTGKGGLAVAHSGKAQKIMALLEAIQEQGEKTLIFTQYKEMGTLLKQMCQDHLGITPLFFHGGVPRKRRDAMVEQFQEEAETPIMILSLKAGGSGLNLTQASNVIHYDLWWNPAVESQATDRAYRIGQKNRVMVHRLITLNTFEEKIDAMIQAKKKLADMAMATGETWLSEASDSELRDLFTLSL